MEIEEVQAELQALWKLYALQHQIGDGTRTSESSTFVHYGLITTSIIGCISIVGFAGKLFKDLLDHKLETTIRSTYSEIISTAHLNEPLLPPPPPPGRVHKKECKLCHQRSLKRQASIVQDSETKIPTDSVEDSNFMEDVRLIDVPETSRRPKQLIIREARPVPSSASNSSGSSWVTQAETSPSRSISDTSGSYSYTTRGSVGSSTNSFSSYSIEKPVVVRTPIARAGPARRRGRARSGDVIGTVKRMTKKLFHRPEHHRGASKWEKAKELFHHRRQDKPNRPHASSEQKAKNRKEKVVWWPLKRRKKKH